MVSTPTWLAATAGQRQIAGQVNQFLGSHQAQFLYQGALQVSQVTGSGVYSDTLSQWLAQSVTTAVGQTSVGFVQLQVSAIGGSPTLNLIPPLTVSLYASSSGVPTGAPLASTTVSGAYIYSAPFWVTIPLPVSGLTPSTTYQLVTALVGTSGHYYAWQHSNQVSGAATSATGTSWAVAPYGLMYQVYDQSQVGQLQLIYEDAGARWTQLTYASNGTIAQVAEYTAGQTASGGVQSLRTLTYTNGLLTGVN